jgi:hypothetical protein
MDPATVALGGSVFGTAANIWQNHQNLGFQKDLAQHGISWKVADMKAAGINPILAVNPGSSASTGGGTNIPVQSPTSGYVQYKLQQKQMEQYDAAIQKMEEETNLIKQKAKSADPMHEVLKLLFEGFKNPSNSAKTGLSNLPDNIKQLPSAWDRTLELLRSKLNPHKSSRISEKNKKGKRKIDYEHKKSNRAKYRSKR